MSSLTTECRAHRDDRPANLLGSDSPLVSVIIPNFNHTRYVRDAIQSALDQTYRSFEIIVVDDGSTDNSRQVVGSFGNQVRYIWQKNQGLAGARNTGIYAAKGELIGLLDADDQWAPNFLESMISMAAKHPEATVYYCSAQGMDSDGNELPQLFGRSVAKADAMYQTLLRANFLIPSTIVFRRFVVMAAGLFDQSLRSCEDWDLWLRILPKHLIVGTPACLVRYRLHGNSLSTDPVGMQLATKAVVEKHFGSDDGRRHAWSDKKRRAYGGVYRYHLLTSVQRRNDWQSGASYLRQAIETDPTLATDLELFYELALGSQPHGYRGSSQHLNLKGNAAHVRSMLGRVFGSAPTLEFCSLRRKANGTANFALGLVAYNSGQTSLSRNFLLSAVWYRPDLWRDPRILGSLLKSMISPPVLEKLKRFLLRAQDSWHSIRFQH